ncbi:membrane protein insertase YidC [Spirochaetia bacterium 38H-sp]|uniref:Membrane protein insertase YidC n=1 Tax=Rarispira pelagica TaxID=3141764 RepID=A0ABU9U9S8_9SPIR
MERNVVLAVILSAIVIFASAVINTMFFVPQQSSLPETTVYKENSVETRSNDLLNDDKNVISNDLSYDISVEDNDFPAEQDYVYDNGLVRVVLSNKGAVVKSFELLKHKDGDKPVDMFFYGKNNIGAFNLFLGKENIPIDETFKLERKDNTFEFYRDFKVSESSFKLIKRYVFYPGEYMFKLEVEIINSENKALPLNFDGVSYTLDTGFEIGPEFESLDRYEYRKFYYYSNSKMKEENLTAGKVKDFDISASWIGLAGKYFTLISVPILTKYDFSFSTVYDGLDVSVHRILIYRPYTSGARIRDVYNFYVGPKLVSELSKYNSKEKNSLGLSELKLNKIVDSSFWAPLENILKFFLNLFYKIVPNYGVAIIFLTLFVKLLLFPLTHKSYESTSKLQALSPKMEEIRNKYKDDPQKMNQEIALLYQKEGVNPLGGCLPMLLQLPIFFALYSLFNTHFDLRGAMFIPGWIEDLSIPESIFSLGFNLPFLGSEIRLLPILLVATQILSTKITQGANKAAQGQSMMYILPVVFMFILYNAPAGLLVYWCAMNIFTIFQQMYVNKLMMKKKSSN